MKMGKKGVGSSAYKKNIYILTTSYNNFIRIVLPFGNSPSYNNCTRHFYAIWHSDFYNI